MRSVIVRESEIVRGLVAVAYTLTTDAPAAISGEGGCVVVGGGTEMIGPGPVGVVVPVPPPVAVPVPVAGSGPPAWGAPVLVVVPPAVPVPVPVAVPVPVPMPGVGPTVFAPSLRRRLTFRAF